MKVVDIEGNLLSLGLALPQARAPIANYVPCKRFGNLLYVSGQLPFRDGVLAYTGPVTSENISNGVDAAALCVLNGLSHVKNYLGSLNQLISCLRLGVFVNTQDGFTQHPVVANGASDLIVGLMGEAGRHVRAAIGSNSLPSNTMVEVDMIFEVVEAK